MTLEDDRVQLAAGGVSGVLDGAVPLGPVMADVAIEVRILPKGTYMARVGRACGEIVVGVGQVVLGCSGMGAGIGMSGTGVGAVPGVLVVSGFAAVAANGACSTAHGVGDLQQLLRDGPPPADPPAPTAQAPVAAAPPPKPKAVTPAETTTLTKYKDSSGKTIKTVKETASGNRTTTTNKGARAQATEPVKPKASEAQTTPTVKPKASEAQPVAKGEPPQLARGKRAHKEEPVLPGEKMEAPTPSGKRMDRYNQETGRIREIKPNNSRQIKAGEKQVEQYRQEMENATGRPHTGEVSPYDPKKY